MPQQEIMLTMSQRKADPGQTREFDNGDDVHEIINLLNHLAPGQRVAFLGWMCAQAWIPCSNTQPGPASEMKQLADDARRSDRASDILTMSIVNDIVHLARDYHFDLRRGIEELVTWVRRPTHAADATHAVRRS